MVAFVLTNSHVSTARAAGAISDIPQIVPAVEAPQTLVEPLPTKELPTSKEKTPAALRTVRTTSTAYSSNVWETDGSPYVTADGTCVGDGVVAANFLKIGTKVRFPDLFGDKIFVVHDRMNERYGNRIDVWMQDSNAAKVYGLKRNVDLEIVEEGDGKKGWDLGFTDAKCKQLALAQ